MITCDLNSNSK